MVYSMNEIYEDIELKVIGILFGALQRVHASNFKNKVYDLESNNDDQSYSIILLRSTDC